jgi:hypothetical protein
MRVRCCHGPAVFHEVLGEKVEQFGVVRAFAGFAEIVDGADDAFAEVPAPYAIHHDAGGQGIGGVDEPVGELEAAAAMEFGGSVVAGEDGRYGAGGIFAGIVEIAANQNLLLDGFIFLDSVGHIGLWHGLFLVVFVGRLEGGELCESVLGEDLFLLFFRDVEGCRCHEEIVHERGFLGVELWFVGRGGVAIGLDFRGFFAPLFEFGILALECLFGIFLHLCGEGGDFFEGGFRRSWPMLFGLGVVDHARDPLEDGFVEAFARSHGVPGGGQVGGQLLHDGVRVRLDLLFGECRPGTSGPSGVPAASDIPCTGARDEGFRQHFGDEGIGFGEALRAGEHAGEGVRNPS